MRRFNGTLCPGELAVKPELITDAWKYSFGQGEVKFILICKICDFIPRNPQRINWKTSEINETAQRSPEGMRNILKFPAFLSIILVIAS